METRIVQNNDGSIGSIAASSSHCTISWGAILAGAATAAALSLILLVLGTGLGLSSVSPWTDDGISGKAFGVSTILWITLTSLVASALGGYMAGRLRNRWSATQADEIYFRDTAHGFLAWAISTLVTATLLTSVTAAIIGGGVQATADVAGGVAAATGVMAGAAGAESAKSASTNANTGSDSNPMAYFVDSLFRPQASTSAAPAVPVNSDAAKAEVARIFINGLNVGSLAAEDVRYSAQVVSQQTQLTQAEAEKRVSDTFNAIQTKLREAEAAVKTAAEKTRKASAYTSLWLFVSLLVGAFFASWMAVCGGRHRDLN